MRKINVYNYYSMNHYPICIFSIVVFLAGLYFYAIQANKLKERFSGSERRCPNILVQKGKRLYLYNSKIAKVPGVNPIEFENLEDYVEFTEWQRSQQIKCPILYLQHSYDTQGNSGYKIRPGATDLRGGLPPSSDTVSKLVDATRNDPPYNQNVAPGFDASSYYVGRKTPLDEMDQSEEGLLYSPNPMDPNWGGNDYTQSLIDQGYYKGNQVAIKVNA